MPLSPSSMLLSCSRLRKSFGTLRVLSLSRKVDLLFQTRRGSEKLSQAAADLDDILLAFEKLDEGDNIPEIFCEATDLVKLPPIVADAVTELVQHNSSALEDIKGKLDSLSLDLSSKLASLPPSSFKSGLSAQPKAPAERRENLIVFSLD